MTFPRTAGLGVQPLSTGKEAKTAIICVAQSDWGPDCKFSVYVVLCGACADEAWLFDKFGVYGVVLGSVFNCESHNGV